MFESMVFSWDHGFPLEQYGDDDEPDIREVLPAELVTRLTQWGERFDASWDYEAALFERRQDREDLDQEFRRLAAELRGLGYPLTERAWWRELLEPYWKTAS
ncbi:hypothetical protein ACFWHT_09755 [Microbacterium sp. NPDC058342]|uniref:hypothetical protein n=1 Tax=Microbacterium sp. NPDC058342 TaxID=3346454 RepID=UPI003665E38A